MTDQGIMTELDGVDIMKIVEDFGTPVSVNLEDTIRKRCRHLKSSVNGTIRYACKANTLGAILAITRDEGMEIDAVSVGEAWRALNAGYQPEQILFTKDNADKKELEWMAKQGIFVNCGSLDMIRNYGEAIGPHDCRHIAVRINPGEGHGHHRKCSTGGPASKHGIWYTEIKKIKEIAKESGVVISGIHSHIGSNTNIDEWIRIIESTMQVALKFEDLQFLNFGGGLPVPYRPGEKRINLREFGERLNERFHEFCEEYGKQLRLEIEPGRYVVAEAGFIIGRATAVKKTPEYTFVLLDTGFNHLIRPAMYGSYHHIWVCRPEGGKVEYEKQVIAGPNCESGDVFTQTDDGTLEPRRLPVISTGNLVIIGNTGAYGNAMSSNYNSQPRMTELLITPERKIHLIRDKESFEDLVRGEKMPEYLKID